MAIKLYTPEVQPVEESIKNPGRIGRIYTTCKMSLKNTKNW